MRDPPPEGRQGHGNHQEHQAHEQGREAAGTREGTRACEDGARPPRRGRPQRVRLRAVGDVAPQPSEVLRLLAGKHHPHSDADAHRHPRGQLQELEARLQPLRAQGRARHRDPRAHAREGPRRGHRRGAPPPRGLPRGPRLRRQPDRRRAPRRLRPRLTLPPRPRTRDTYSSAVRARPPSRPRCARACCTRAPWTCRRRTG